MITLKKFVDGHFLGCSWTKLPKTCHTYLTSMKLSTGIPYLNKVPKIYESRDTPQSSADISIFSRKISKICYIKGTDIGFILMHNF